MSGSVSPPSNVHPHSNWRIGRFPSSSLRGRLLVLILLALAPTFGATLYRNLQERQAIAAGAQYDLLALTQRVSGEQEQLIEQARQLLLVLERLPEVRRADPLACSALFADLLEHQKFYANLAAAGLDGDVFCSGQPFSGRVNVSDRDYFRQALETRLFFIGDYQVGRITGKPALNVAYPILDEAGQARGVVFAALDLSWLGQIAGDAQLPEGSSLVVADRRATILARYPSSEVWVGQSMPEAPIVRAMLDRGEGVAEVSGVDGVSRLYAFTPLSRRTESGAAYVAVGFPLEVAFSDVNKFLAGSLLALGISSLLAAVVAWGGARFWILHPVNVLVHATERLRAGDLSVRTQLSGHAGEFGQLARSFDEMAEALQAREAERAQSEEALQESAYSLQEALAELRETQQQVMEQERLRALGEMASGIAHDFNNTLAPIVAYSELLLVRPEQLENHEKVRGYLELINTSAQDATGIVKRLRDFYRHREAGDLLEPVELGHLVAQVLSLSQFRWKDQAQAAGFTIHVETDLRDLPPVAANEADLREALTNLIFNAVDAMPEGGTLSIRTRVEDEHAVLSVQDTGLGMTEEVRRRCLEPFFTTKGEQGTGLGLGMVYGIIQRHQGSLEIESEPGRGTTVSIRLLLERRAEPREALPSVDTLAGRSLCVLVVEDDPPVRGAIMESLTVHGHTVETANDGREGLEKFRSGNFDLVITDRAMPRMSGDQLAAAIRQLHLNLPIIMLTGFGELMSAAGERPLGVDVVLTKPVTPTALRQAIAQVTSHEAASRA